ncbi:MAG: hypothetical protein K6L81_16815 [Agarilytica sp.]
MSSFIFSRFNRLTQYFLDTNTDNGLIRNRQYLIIVVIAISSTLLVYAPFILHDNIDILFRYWDGPNYAYLAKSLYSVPTDHPLNAYTTPEYFAAHLPVYPLSIRLFSFMGYFNAMLFTSALYATLATIVLYQLLLETRVVENPLWSAIISLFIPARYLIYHSIGATEAPFLFFTLSSLLAYVRGHYVLAFILGGISGITRITGILIGGAYFMTLVFERKWKTIPLLSIIALPLFLTFVFYHFHYGDFFAYFGTNYSDSNKLISLIPFDIFRTYSSLGETHSAEFYLILYAIYGVGTALLWNINRLFFWFCSITLTFSIFIYHQDVSRYMIPMAPLAIVVAYDKILSQTPVKFVFLPAVFLAYIYSWGVLEENVVDKRTYYQLTSYLDGSNEIISFQSDLQGLSITACRYTNCDSTILSKKSGIKQTPERGLNIYIYREDGSIEFVKKFDHCVDNDIYLNSQSLSSTIEDNYKDADKILLLSSDTVACRNKKVRGLNDWTTGLDLKKLENIRFRETYIGVVDLSTYETIEFKSKDLIQFP